jgi:hypothetical protein
MRFSARSRGRRNDAQNAPAFGQLPNQFDAFVTLVKLGIRRLLTRCASQEEIS